MLQKIYLGCGLWVVLSEDGTLRSELPKNNPSARLLLKFLMVSIKQPAGTAYACLQDFINTSGVVALGMEIYLGDAEQQHTKLARVAEIKQTLAQTLHIELIQEIGAPILRAAVYGILPMQKEPLPSVMVADIKPTTDLHTHFTGAITADMLLSAFYKRIELNAQKKQNLQIHYKIKYLESVGIDIAELPPAINKRGQVEAGYVDITPLVKMQDSLEKFRLLLEIPVDKRIIFDQMEDYYGYRGVFIQDVELFPFFLQELAKDYQRQGIHYVEISFAKVAKPSYLNVIHETLPRIEAETGVTIRFLAMLCRTATVEVRALQVQKYEHISLSSPYVVGIDLLSAEINSSYAFYPELTYIAQNFPNKIVRVHAGETSYHLENVKAVVKLAKRFPRVRFRIGHGTYGVDDDVIQEIQQTQNIIIEINMASNITLNMHDGKDGHPIDTYLRNDVPVVLGSDGHGLYQSRNTDLVAFLTYRYPLSDTLGFMENIQKTEQEHIVFSNSIFVEESRTLFRCLVRALDQIEFVSDDVDAIKAHIILLLNLDNSTLSQIQKIYLTIRDNPTVQKLFVETTVLSPSVHEQYRKIAERKAALDQQTKQQNASTIQTVQGIQKQMQDVFDVVPFFITMRATDSNPKHLEFQDKTPLMLSGVLPYSSYGNTVFFETLKQITAIIKTLLETLDNTNVYFVTTGQDVGIQKIMHTLIGEHNHTCEPERRFDLVAYAPKSVKGNTLSRFLSHVVVLEDIKTIYQMYQYFSKLAFENNLLMVNFSENMWLKDVSHVVREARQEAKAFIDGIHGIEALGLILGGLDAKPRRDYQQIYNEHLTAITSIQQHELLAGYGSFLHHTPSELAQLILLALDEEKLTEEQKDCAFVNLTKCFQLLLLNVGDPDLQCSSVRFQLDVAFLLTEKLKQNLAQLTLQLWQDATQTLHGLTIEPPIVREDLRLDSHDRRATFFKSKTKNPYNAPIGDKVSFKLSRKNASPDNYTVWERIAIRAVLDELQRKRVYKKSEELKYLVCLLLVGKNTSQATGDNYLAVCADLLIYLSNKFALGIDISSRLNGLEQELLVVDNQDASHIKALIQNMLETNKLRLTSDNNFDQPSVDALLNALARSCIGEYTFGVLRTFFKALALSTHTEERRRYFSEMITNYTDGYFYQDSFFGETNGFIINRIINMGLCFDTIEDTLTQENFTYKALHNGEDDTLGFYYQDKKVLDVYWGNARYYPVSIVNSVQIYKKYRLLEDRPWDASEFLDEQAFEYIQDKRGNFVRRFTYRCIRPTERMLLAQNTVKEIIPKSAKATFDEIEGNRQNKKFFLMHPERARLSQEVITDELAELSLNRMGTYRFVTSGQSAHKYDLRANNETLFLRHACKFESVLTSTSNLWQGGGVIKIDLTKIPREDIRSQYKTSARVNMDNVKKYIGGVYNQKLPEEFSRTSDRLLASELDSQINKARKSALRNRETHLSKLPTDAIVGWKPFHQFPVWLGKKQISMPILLSDGEYFTHYPVCDTAEPKSEDFITSLACSMPGVGTLDDFMNDVNSPLADMLKLLGQKLKASQGLDEHALSCILKAMTINLHFAHHYLAQQEPQDVLSLSKLLFIAIQAEISEFRAFNDVATLANKLSPLITQSIAIWSQKGGGCKPYSNNVSMAFYLSPEKTVQQDKVVAWYH
jgi:adenosine deaminase